MAANAGETKVKLWEGICYPENMRDDWQDEIDDILQVPFAYAVHDIDHDQKSKQRKTHAHVIVVWGGNTTRKAIINVLNRLSADGKKCCSSAEPINNIRHAYDYLIHDTASCRKKGKELYPVEARIEGNNFDIGQLEQLSTKDKQDMLLRVGRLHHVREVRDHQRFHGCGAEGVSRAVPRNHRGVQLDSRALLSRELSERRT